MFYSCLFSAEAARNRSSDAPNPTTVQETLNDLNLDEVFAGILTGRPHLRDIFCQPLDDSQQISYRQAILRELHDPRNTKLTEALAAFSTSLTQLVAEAEQAEQRAGDNPQLGQGRCLNRAELYCQQVLQLKAALRLWQDGEETDDEGDGRDSASRDWNDDGKNDDNKDSGQPDSLKPAKPEPGTAADRAAGLSQLLAYLEDYCSSADFSELVGQVLRLRTAFAQIHDNLLLRPGSVAVYQNEDELDLNSRLASCFHKFRLSVDQGSDDVSASQRTSGHPAATGAGGGGTETMGSSTTSPDRTAPAAALRDYRERYSDQPRAAYIEEAILRILARHHPDEFAALNAFTSRHWHFIDPSLARLAQEIPFYLDWLRLIKPLERAGLAFCLPTISEWAEDLSNQAGFDLALALRLDRESQPARRAELEANGQLSGQPADNPIVTNDFACHGLERIIVVTGPNSGGKTTFARTFGQLHYLASLGLCVPGRQARLFKADMVYTHFAREETTGSNRGELQDDLFRLHAILSRATSRSVIIANEIFSSTTTSDALALSRKMMGAIRQLGIPAVVVGFLDELASLGPEVLSLMSTVDPTEPRRRTFKIVRQRPDGRAHAGDIAYQYRLDYEQLLKRLSGSQSRPVVAASKATASLAVTSPTSIASVETAVNFVAATDPTIISPTLIGPAVTSPATGGLTTANPTVLANSSPAAGTNAARLTANPIIAPTIAVPPPPRQPPVIPIPPLTPPSIEWKRPATDSDRTNTQAGIKA